MLTQTSRLGIRLDLEGVGWLSADIEGDDLEPVHLTASYLSDAPGNLLRAVLQSVTGVPMAACIWDEEPGEYVWVLSQVGHMDMLRMLVVGRDFESLFDPDEVDPRNGVQLDVEAPIGVIASAIADSVDELRSRLGVAGYEEQWLDHPFPAEPLAAVRAAIAERPPR